jgi:hypothetical protein
MSPSARTTLHKRNGRVRDEPFVLAISLTEVLGALIGALDLLRNQHEHEPKRKVVFATRKTHNRTRVRCPWGPWLRSWLRSSRAFRPGCRGGWGVVGYGAPPHGGCFPPTRRMLWPEPVASLPPSGDQSTRTEVDYFRVCTPKGHQHIWRRLLISRLGMPGRPPPPRAGGHTPRQICGGLGETAAAGAGGAYR